MVEERGEKVKAKLETKAETKVETTVETKIKASVVSKELQVQANEQTAVAQKLKTPAGKDPLFLGISLDTNPDVHKILKYLAQRAFDILIDEFDDSDGELSGNKSQVLSALSNPTHATPTQPAAWKKPQTWHLTQLFRGSRPANRDSAIFKNFKEGQPRSVQFRGVVFVPGRLLVGVCFQKEVENKHPHVTLLTAGWPPKTSNTVLDAAIEGSKEFKEWYEALKAGQPLKERQVAYDSKVKGARPRTKPEPVEVFGIGLEPDEYVTVDKCTT